MVLRIVPGAVYVAMGAGQLLSWQAMPRILDSYHWVPGKMLPRLAMTLIVGELSARVWLLARPKSRALTPVWIYSGVAAAWSILGAQAYLRGLTVNNCGCFGLYLSQRLSCFTLLQDGLLLVYAALMIRDSLRCRPATAAEVPDRDVVYRSRVSRWIPESVHSCWLISPG